MFAHLDRKYFRYRAAAVARAQAEFPARAGILALSELMRLGFVAAGALLCGLIDAVLTVTAGARVGPADWRTACFALVTVFCAWIAARTLWAVFRSRAALRSARQATGA